jgi:hypothetical protein
MHFQKPPLGTPLDWGNPLNDETVLALAMNEGNGDKVQDLSLNGNHGTLNNFAFPPTTASGWNPGQTGIGLNFDGTNDHINCDNNPVLDILGDITIAVTLKRGRLNTDEALVSRAEYNVSGYELYIPGVNILRYRTYQAGAKQSTDSIVHALTGDYERIVVTREGNRATIYRDGIDITDVHGNHSDPVTNTHNMNIGNRPITFGLPFDGSIDQPRIMNRAWSAKEVKDYAINPWQVYLDGAD